VSDADGRIAVALSGGVDSSVAAALLQEQGSHVEGVTMRLMPEWVDPLRDEDAIAAAQEVCQALGIAHHIVDFVAPFARTVIADFAAQYRDGRTPNPCILCNETIKFGALWEWARGQGFDALATGHYARIDGEHLMRAADSTKDQSYFLYRVARSRLVRIRFPLQNLTKTQVKEYARAHTLPCAERAESQDICFIEAGERQPVIAPLEPDAYRSGAIVTSDGMPIGEHAGLAHYTVGQRHGLGLGGQAEPLYVIALDAQTNRLVVGTQDALLGSEVVSTDFVIDEAALGATSGSWEVTAQVRYHMRPMTAQLDLTGDRMTVTFAEPVAAISPGQSAVCYRGDVVVAGGIIDARVS